MKLLFLILTFSALASERQELRNAEFDCWHKAVDQGSFFCQHLMILGKITGEPGYVLPELTASNDDDGNWRQANHACTALGFRYASGFTLASAENETWMGEFSESAFFAWRGTGKFIQHLRCQ